MIRRITVFLIALACLAVPAIAAAQGTVAGVVRSTSGAPLPGAFVEASGPAGSRSATTNVQGQYRIVDLRPGVYTVTFTLAGFQPSKVDGIQLTGSETRTVNGDLVPAAPAQAAASARMEIYGFAMLDMGINFKTIDPNWFDTMRINRLPSSEDQFGEDGSTFAGVRQTRFGAKSYSPTALGELRTTFEFELFGVGVDEGQTTFRLRHAYGEVGKFGAGQYWSPFMDIDVFPNSLEYWGPTGMVFFRNVQVRYMPIQGDTRLTLAVERPGASGDTGEFADRIELQDVQGRSPMPDFTGEYRLGGQSWGYVEVAGLLGWMKWDDLNGDQFDLSGSATRWGVNLSSNVKLGSATTLRLQYVFGEGIQNYMNDSPVDVGVVPDLSDPVAPFKGEAIPIQGLVLFVDHNWNSKWSTSAGYSRQDIDNTVGQADDAFKTGEYALGNLLYTPVPGVMIGGELQWGKREMFRDPFEGEGLKLQFSFKYNFSATIGGR
jgi:DcaP outer membrane protein/Carboxypeptidase regulatory-like domain